MGASATHPTASVMTKFDMLALSIGSRITVSALFLVCLLTIVVGAQSILGSMKKMEADLKVLTQALKVANEGTDTLNVYMDSLPPMSESLIEVVGTVEATSKEVGKSKAAINQMADTTDQLNAGLGNIASGTTSMRTSLESVDRGTTSLSSSVTDVAGKIGPLATTQHNMLLETQRMKKGIADMNASLAYTIRIMNYMAKPPTGQGFTVRVDMDPKTLPPIPGVKAKTDPVEVFPAGSLPVYRGK